MKRIIVAGINTEVGKTVVSAILTESLDGFYWKPVQCGLPDDRSWVDRHLSSKGRCYPSSFVLETPCSPHLAARNEGVRIEVNGLVPPLSSEFLVIEGTGGLLSPLNETADWADAAVHWDAHWVLVHRHYLGSLNHFALTVEAMQQRKISLLGVVFNGKGEMQTEEMLLHRAKTRCLGRLAWETQFTPKKIQDLARSWKPTLLEALGL